MAIVGIDQNIARLGFIEPLYAKRLKIIFAESVDLIPALLGRAWIAPVPEIVALGDIEATCQVRIPLAVELDRTKRDLAADQKFLGALVEIELPVCAWSKCGIQLGAGTVGLTGPGGRSDRLPRGRAARLRNLERRSVQACPVPGFYLQGQHFQTAAAGFRWPDRFRRRT